MEKIWIDETTKLTEFYRKWDSEKTELQKKIKKLREKTVAFNQLYQELLSGRSSRVNVEESKVVTDIRKEISALENEYAEHERILSGANPVDGKVIQCLVQDNQNGIIQLSEQELSTSVLARFVRGCFIVEQNKAEAVKYLESCFDNNEFGERARVAAAFAEYYYGEQQREKEKRHLRAVGAGSTGTVSRVLVRSKCAELRREYQKEEQRIRGVKKYEKGTVRYSKTDALLEEIEKQITELQKLEDNAIISIERAQNSKKEIGYEVKGHRLTIALCALFCIVPMLLGFGMHAYCYAFGAYEPAGIVSFFPIPLTKDITITNRHSAPYIIAWGPRQKITLRGSDINSKMLIMPFAKFEHQYIYDNEDEEITILGNSSRIDINGCHNVKSIAIPEGTEYVYIQNCNNLQELLLPSSVESVTVEACPQFSKLGSADEKDSLQKVSFHMRNCSDTIRLEVSEGVEYVTINECQSLQYVTLGSDIDVVTIGGSYNKSGDSVLEKYYQEAMGSASIEGCDNLVSVYSDTLKLISFQGDFCAFPETVECVSISGMNGNGENTENTLEDILANLPFIHHLCLQGRDNKDVLETIVIPVNADSIYVGGMYDAERLIFSGDVKEILIQGSESEPLREIVIPDTVEYISTYGTYNLESVVTPDGFDLGSIQGEITYKKE